MRLQRLGKDLVEQAVAVYLQEAWPLGPPEAVRKQVDRLHAATNLKQIREVFQAPEAKDNVVCHRYTLRLGNHKYPFMKFVLQEYLVAGEYFFSVDTHDELKVTPNMPDYDEWNELRRFNQELKLRIEGAWSAAGLPTHEDLRRLMEEIASREHDPRRRGRILLVDDEDEVAEGLAAIFRARGFEVQLAFDGRQVLPRLEASGGFDLIVLDFSMPEMTGEQVLAQLRADPRFRDQPVLLATASDIDLGRVPTCAAYLRKPYPRELLLAMVDQLLGCEEC
ncbi:MAG: response regulator [Planctomycetes bacterium]|nr:response regulator [Planctomycetota bacterium]MCB9909269.1 response regulator [Planctomycetota bacterium]HPF14255.1 response regulator [Planctomycetota bacterium]HRV81531.1 response regulator [Planctomycetota bacterium]